MTYAETKNFSGSDQQIGYLNNEDLTESECMCSHQMRLQILEVKYMGTHMTILYIETGVPSKSQAGRWKRKSKYLVSKLTRIFFA